METNPRGIPKAPFIENVEEYLAGATAEATLSKFDEMIKKYKFMESNLRTREASLNSKIPEIKSTLETVKLLISQNELGEALETDFELNDTLYAKATIEGAENVCIWLGANVMIEYPIDEAENLLSTKLTQATTSLTQTAEDLEFLREQITTMEVNLARVYNWDVKNRKKTKA
ncbi:Prefoldin subunit-domain-containing protein [Catenaria anguillulae PL171]|uniref:Prefoldin subunit 3 n=1 Tax=Catenaria anguillulae PL171 TaxID=765915 RepID=A0A1Y2HP28_9FUNG|nr:Prefoldin subunit-domain-containing protein [Catenaria anguillulae PL171]